MNVAGRLENSGEKGMIHISEACAELIRDGGKGRWITRRDDKIYAKGKGELQTYWLTHGSLGNVGDYSEGAMSDDRGFDVMPAKTSDSPKDQQKRLVQWNAEVLLDSLKGIVAFRRTAPRRFASSVSVKSTSSEPEAAAARMPLEEVKEIITLPEFNGRVVGDRSSTSAVEISDVVVQELGFFVTTIAQLYRDNPFHNFGTPSRMFHSFFVHMRQITHTT